MSTMFIGNEELKKLYIGQNEIKKIYLGDNVIWSGESEYPEGFRPVEYLTSKDGHQYINTLFQPTNRTKFVVQFDGFGWTKGGFCNLETNANFYFYIRDIDTKYIQSNFGTYSAGRVDVKFTHQNIIEMDYTGLYLNGQIIHKYPSVNNFASSNYILLFGYNNNGTPIANREMLNMYYSKIYDNDELARDFQPGLDANNRPCMYDRVSKELFYNQGTGEFQYGSFI